MIQNTVPSINQSYSKTVEDNLSELILDGNQIEGKVVIIDHDGDDLNIISMKKIMVFQMKAMK